jgi:quinone-modifying oxidoreductase subunit QmoA
MPPNRQPRASASTQHHHQHDDGAAGLPQRAHPGQDPAPSDDKAPESVAFVQCAGSRDENHLPYCSYICCMASLKQATYVASSIPMPKFISSTSISGRPGSATKSSTRRSKKMRNVFLIKGKVAEVSEDPEPRTSPWLPKTPSPGKNPPDRGYGCPGHRHAAHRRQCKLPADLKYTRRLHHQ